MTQDALVEQVVRGDLERFLELIPTLARLEQYAEAAGLLAGSLAYYSLDGSLDAAEALALLRPSLAFLDEEAFREALVVGEAQGEEGYRARRDAIARVLAYAARGRPVP